MHYIIALMEEEHVNINRMIAVVRNMCCNVLEGGEVPVPDITDEIDFIRNYSDKHHHGKEEKILFPVMVAKFGKVAENLITHGMLVEHELGRGHVLSCESALRRYKNEPTTMNKLQVISGIMGWANLLENHTSKENIAVYGFAERMLPEDEFSKMNKATLETESAATKAGTQKKYLDLLARLEEKWCKGEK